MPSIYTSTVGSTTVGANTRKLPATPISNFGTPVLRAISVSVADANLSTTPTISNSLLSQAVRSLQQQMEIYYVGAFTNANPSVGLVLVHDNTENDGSAATPSLADGSFGAAEASIVATVTGATACTITGVTPTGLTFS
jgi:hypothetical protein